MPAWYIAMCVNAPTPVTSPTAHSRSPARIRSSTSSALRLRVEPDGVEAELADPGPPPDADEQLGAAHRRTVLEPHDDLAVRALAGHVHRLGARCAP